jgi:hypothetical protein
VAAACKGRGGRYFFARGGHTGWSCEGERNANAGTGPLVGAGGWFCRQNSGTMCSGVALTSFLGVEIWCDSGGGSACSCWSRSRAKDLRTCLAPADVDVRVQVVFTTNRRIKQKELEELKIIASPAPPTQGTRPNGPVTLKVHLGS